jgi:hypothetical protein
VQPATPFAAASASAPACTSATTASAALSTLKAPTSAVPPSTVTPSGPASRNELPAPATSTFSTRQSAPSRPLGDTVTTGIFASVASRSPYGSSTLITPTLLRPGVNRVALTAK